MAHVWLDEQWIARGTREEVSARVVAALKKTGVAVFPADPIRFTGGSGCLTRLIGGWFVGPGTLPKAGHVALTPGDDGAITVALHVEDAMGFALVDPMFKKRFLASFAPIVAAVKKASEGA